MHCIAGPDWFLYFSEKDMIVTLSRNIVKTKQLLLKWIILWKLKNEVIVLSFLKFVVLITKAGRFWFWLPSTTVPYLIVPILSKKFILQSSFLLKSNHRFMHCRLRDGTFFLYWTDRFVYARHSKKNIGLED